MSRLALSIAVALALSAVVLADGGVSPRCPPAEDDAVALLACGEQAIDRSRFKSAARWLGRALEIVEDGAPGDRLHGSILFQLARLARERGDLDAAAAVYGDALERLDARVNADDPVRVQLLLLYAEALAGSESPAAALEPAHLAVEIAEVYDDDEHDLLAPALSRLGSLSQRANDDQGAIAAYRRVVGLFGWEPHRRLLGAVRELARLEAESGRVDDAARAYVLAIRTYRLAYGASNREVAGLVDELAALGRDHERADLVERAEAFTREESRRRARLDEPPAAAGVVHTPGTLGVTNPKRLEYVAPVFPEKGRVERVEGSVILQIVVLPDGTVGQVDVLRCSNPGYGFEEAARFAVRQWTFEPATKDGAPVAAYFTVSTSFTLN